MNSPRTPYGDAEAIIWVSENIRDEHGRALEWLNRHTDEGIGFFGVAVDVLQIDASPPAVNFKPVVFPNVWQRAARQSLEAPTARYEAYRSYFKYYSMNSGKNTDSQMRELGSPRTVLLGFVVQYSTGRLNTEANCPRMNLDASNARAISTEGRL